MKTKGEWMENEYKWLSQEIHDLIDTTQTLKRHVDSSIWWTSKVLWNNNIPNPSNDFFRQQNVM